MYRIQLNQLDSGFEKLDAQVAEELDQNREDYAKEILVTCNSAFAG